MARQKRIKKFYSSENYRSIPILPKEMVIEILLRLPVKCLLQCKSVCKSWYSLISDPYFVKSHLSISSSNNRYAHHRLMMCGSISYLKTCSLYDVMHDKSVNLSELHCPLKDPRDIVYIIGSCNGLLCMAREDAVFICNPSTRTSNRIPSCGFKVALFGFGYDKSFEDYKVVAVASLSDRVKMYSLKSAKWKKIGDFPRGLGISLWATGSFCNGTLHWISRSNSNSVYPSRIVSLDLATKAYGEVLQPVYDECLKEIGALGEWLVLVCTYRGNRADVWMMKVYGDPNSWTKLVSIPDRKIRWGPIPCFANDEKILLIFSTKLVLYDVKNGSSSKIKSGSFAALPWIIVESLVSPSGPRRQSARRRRKSR